METSIIIRVKNEKEHITKLLRVLKDQTDQNFEVIIVNNASTDGSDKIVFDYFSKDRIQIIEILEFSYPKACNMGAERARGKYLVYLSAHSYPISNTWLSDGLSNFKNDKVAGVSAFPIQGPEATLSEKIYGIPSFFTPKRGGHLQNTNSIIRKDLWEKHKFNQNLVISEDLEWSLYWERKGYVVINDPRFRVYHSHGLGFLGLIKQSLKWQKSRLLVNKSIEN